MFKKEFRIPPFGPFGQGSWPRLSQQTSSNPLFYKKRCVLHKPKLGKMAQNGYHQDQPGPFLMKRITDLLNYLFKFAVVGLALAFVVLNIWPGKQALFPATGIEPTDTPILAPGVDSYADAVSRAAPSVVSIYTQTDLQPVRLRPELQRWLGRSVYNRQVQGLGSGVILDQEGYILTNNHVINDADDIWVGFWDGRISKADLTGADIGTDLAVLKVNRSDLPVAPTGEANRLKVGDVVLAIGNAAGLSHTVTMGIVSATGRNEIRGALFQDFIQTDTAINQGNSGGALINSKGDIIGISTSSLNQSQGTQGISFAIPIDLAQMVMNEIIDYGTVRRGWLGASFDNLPFGKLEDGSAARLEGLMVRQVVTNGPAWLAGLRQGDILIRAGGEPVTDIRDFLFNVAQMSPGTELELEVVRNDNQFTTRATLIQLPPLRP